MSLRRNACLLSLTGAVAIGLFTFGCQRSTHKDTTSEGPYKIQPGTQTAHRPSGSVYDDPLAAARSREHEHDGTLELRKPIGDYKEYDRHNEEKGTNPSTTTAVPPTIPKKVQSEPGSQRDMSLVGPAPSHPVAIPQQVAPSTPIIPSVGPSGADENKTEKSLHAPTKGTLARDLGEGAGGERLGHPGLEPDRRERPDISSFVSVDSAGGDASTFAADVDTASYNLVRSCLTEQRRWPQPNEVRVEEMINRFTYNYPTPDRGQEHPFRIAPELTACPWNPSHYLVRVAIAGQKLKHRQRPPANLVFLLDVSGSMSDENKLPLLKRSMLKLVDQLNEDDRVAIVTYAGRASVALNITDGGEHRRIRNAINRLGAGGSTHGAAGIVTAYQMARDMHRKGSETRVILGTDGDFNVGTTGHDDLVRLVRREAEAGIYLTALGFGMGGGGDARLQHLADNGNGFHAFIDREDEADRLFGERLPSSLVTIAQDVKIQVFFNPSTVAAWRLIGYDNRRLQREDFNDDRVDAGEIGAGHTMTALYEIIPAGADIPIRVNDPNPFINGDHDDVRPVRVQHREAFAAEKLMRIRLRYQPPGGGRSTLMETDLSKEAFHRRASADTRLAMGVALVGQLLRGDRAVLRRGSWGLARELIEDAQDAAERRDLIRLIDAAERIDR